MRLYGPGSVATPARILLDALLVLAGFLVAAQLVVTAVLLVNPLHPVRQQFQVTTMATVPAEVWRTEDLVHVVPGSATVRVDPWAYITYLPASRVFVFVTAVVSFSGWACVLLALLNLRRAFTNIAAGTPFPRDNIRRIRVAGWAILGLAAVELIIDAAMFIYMRYDDGRGAAAGDSDGHAARGFPAGHDPGRTGRGDPRGAVPRRRGSPGRPGVHGLRGDPWPSS